MALIIPKNNADAQTLDETLKIYYEANDWVQNSVLIDKLSSALDNLGIENEKKEPQSYTKKTQVLAYFGFITWQDVTNSQSPRRITELGKKFYEARLERDKNKVIEVLIEALSTCTFGRNVIGCDSDSDIEAPNVFIKASLLLKGLSNNEFAYILGRMELHGEEFHDAVLKIKVNRIKEIKTYPEENAKKWNDPKPITALKNWGFFNSDDNTISDNVFLKYADQLLALRTKNTETVRFRPVIEPMLTNDDENGTFLPYLTAIRTKPFLLLAGISGTGKSRIVRKLAQATDDIDSFMKEEERWKLHKPANFELIQVKPNWHNSMDVVGFQSNIPEPHYEFTPFVDFVVKAWCHEDTPFFLCLDEMNLAPVEEYFAEFLSAIESRSVGEDDEFETDPIIKPFDSFGTELSGKMMHHFIEMGYDLPSRVETRLRKKGLTLPKNLIVMGTVNMDETTFSFSRKVLDRAMSIEMNEVNYDDFIEGKTENDIPLLTAQNGLLVNRPISAQEVKESIESQEVMDFLKGVNDILKGTPFKLGYRAANEALLYVAADKQLGANNLKVALDNFTLMKILSRIEGDESKLVTQQGDKLLDKLYELLNSEGVFGSLDNSKSLAKLTNMQDTLKRDHFVSFWG